MAQCVSETATGIVLEDRGNGAGYRLFAPTHLGMTALPDIATHLRFAELPEILEQTATRDSCLVIGAPGSGKTNLIEDVETVCEQNSIPSLRLTLHINAGSPSRGPENVNYALDLFQTARRQTGSGIMIVDNVDYIGYKGKSRTLASARNYGQVLVPTLASVITEPTVKSIGTMHTMDWQHNHWQWHDADIDGAQWDLITAFHTLYRFDGLLTTDGLDDIVGARLAPFEPDRAAQVLTILRAMKPCFHIAHHVDLELLLENPQAAVAEVMRGRETRMGRDKAAKGGSAELDRQPHKR